MDVGEITTVVVVDDHYLIIELLTRAIDDHPGLDLIGTASDGATGFELIRGALPHFALVEARMCGSNEGIALANAVAEQRLATRVLLLSGYSDTSAGEVALAAGAASFVVKNATSCDVAQAIVSIVASAATISRSPQPVLRDYPRAGRRTLPQRVPELSRRETETLGLTSEGLGAKQIAWRLGISEDTVRTFLRRTYCKLGVSNAPAAVATAMQQGFLM